MQTTIRYLRDSERRDTIYGCVVANSPNHIGWSILHPLDEQKIEDCHGCVKHSVRAVATLKSETLEIMWNSATNRKHVKSGMDLVDFAAICHQDDGKKVQRNYTLRSEHFNALTNISERMKQQANNENTKSD